MSEVMPIAGLCLVSRFRSGSQVDPSEKLPLLTCLCLERNDPRSPAFALRIQSMRCYAMDLCARIAVISLFDPHENAGCMIGTLIQILAQPRWEMTLIGQDFTVPPAHAGALCAAGHGSIDRMLAP